MDGPHGFGVEAVSAGLIELLVWLVVFGTGFTLLGFAALRRLGGRALHGLWLLSTLTIGLWVGHWASTAFYASPPRLLPFYLIPLIFFAVQYGLVAVALRTGHNRGMRSGAQLLLGLLVFAVATIPAALLALVPAVILLLLDRSDTLAFAVAVTVVPGGSGGSNPTR